MKSFLLVCVFLFMCEVMITQAYPQWYSAFRGNRRRNDQSTIQVCGSEAQQFMHWYCSDKSFRIPYKLYLAGVIRTKGMLTDLQADPFHHQAVKCCRHGCKAHEFKWMCNFHKELQKCRSKPPRSTRRGKPVSCHKQVKETMSLG